MAFDKILNKEIAKKDIDFENSIITVGVYSYNEGEKKLGLSRQNKKEDGSLVFSKLGRLTKTEVVKVIEAMGEMLPHME